jgi:hypothetical protein
MAARAREGDRDAMALRTASAVLWFFAAWSLGAGGALYLHTDERLGIVAGVAIAALILHREIVALARTIGVASGLAVLPQRSEDPERTTP